MVSLSDSCFRMLKLLRAEPWLTAEQLSRWAGRSTTRLYADLKTLLQQGLVQRVNPRCVHMKLRAVYALTDRAIQVLAEQAHLDARAYRQSFPVSRARHLEILWRIEQVCSVRDLLLELHPKGGQLQFANTLVREPYPYRGRQQVIQLQGSARLVNAEGYALRLAVEWDNARVRLDRKRLTEFSEWLWHFWDWEPERNLPMLLFVMANDARLDQLWDLLYSHKDFGLNLYAALLVTTVERRIEHGANAPIWLSVEKNEWQKFTNNQAWIPQEECQCYVLRDAHSARIGKFQWNGKNQTTLSETERLLQLKLSLSVQAKRILMRIATRPLLSVEQLAWLMEENPDRVSKAMQELVRANLVQGIVHQRTHRYLLSARGTRYEAAEHGFGRAVKRYLRRTGGRSGSKRLVFHLEHTIAANDFFLQWIRLARATKTKFEWSNEIECACYFRVGSSLHRFLPDGRGVWYGKGEPFRFVVEIDRTRESPTNLIAKFDEYFYWQLWGLSQRQAEPEPNILVVTTGWTQAEVIAELLEQSARKIMLAYPLWVTTFEMLHQNGIDAPIWRSNVRATGLHCLPCFDEVVTLQNEVEAQATGENPGPEKIAHRAL